MAKYMNPDTDYGDDNTLNSSYISINHIIETARKDGREKRNIEIAKSMKDAGMSNQYISDITGLSEKEIDFL